jgi:hypothetical protein
MCSPLLNWPSIEKQPTGADIFLNIEKTAALQVCSFLQSTIFTFVRLYSIL